MFSNCRLALLACKANEIDKERMRMTRELVDSCPNHHFGLSAKCITCVVTELAIKQGKEMTARHTKKLNEQKTTFSLKIRWRILVNFFKY